MAKRPNGRVDTLFGRPKGEWSTDAIKGPTVEWESNRQDVDEPCSMKGVRVADNCLYCPLSVCKYDDLKQARREVTALIKEGKLKGWTADTELSVEV